MDIARLARMTLAAALAAGADEADLCVAETREFTAQLRLGELELLKEASARSVDLRVFRDGGKAVLSSTELGEEACRHMAAEAVALAAISEPDEVNRLPEPELYAAELPALDLFDSTPAPATERRIELARELEAAALGADSRIENSQGASFARSESLVSYLTSNGFEASHRRSAYSLSVMPVARDSRGDLVTESWGKGAPHLADLEDPASLGAEAARRVLRRLDAGKAPTGRFPVIFEPRPAARVLGMLFGCLAGSAVWRGRSYLADRLGDQIASERFTLSDEPHRPRGLGSRPCDGEGLACRRLEIVGAGQLKHFATDIESSRRLKLPATGHGQWGGGVAPSNLYLSPGETSPEEIIAATERGLLVIGMMGRGFNPASGHWSQGCTGLWIEGGEIAYPVSELTIAGSFDEVLGGIDMIGDDLDFSLGAVVSPTFRVAAMAVGGA